MPEKQAAQGDEGDRREMRVIFTETGHRTLNALLIVSGGATVAFLTFLGGAVQQPDLAPRIGAVATKGFAEAMTFFFLSVLYAVLAHGTTYASHAAHHYSATFSRKPRAHRLFRWLGQILMWGTVIVCVVCFIYLWRGGFWAIKGFNAVAEALTQRTSTGPTR